MAVLYAVDRVAFNLVLGNHGGTTRGAYSAPAGRRCILKHISLSIFLGPAPGAGQIVTTEVVQFSAASVIARIFHTNAYGAAVFQYVEIDLTGRNDFVINTGNQTVVSYAFAGAVEIWRYL